MKSGLFFAVLVQGASPAGDEPPPVDAQPQDEASASAIVVTSRKYEEPMVEVPVAVSVVSSDFIDTAGFVQIGEIAKFVPNLDLTTVSSTRATGPKIRGISTFSFSDGLESSVATVVDGVVLGREAQGFFDLYDVERVEIIKGPQGTLFGKNASAGVINIVTREPEREFGGHVTASYGSFDTVRLSGAVTGPLSDKAAFRIAGLRHRRDGWIENAIPGEPDLNDKDSWALRGKLAIYPGARLTLRAVVDAAWEDDRCCVPTFREAADATPVIDFALNPMVEQLGVSLSRLGIVADPDNRSAAAAYRSVRNFAKTAGASLHAEYEFGGFSLISISAWRDFSLDEFNEPDGVSASNVASLVGSVSQGNQFSQELRVAGSVGDAVDLVAGVLYFDQSLKSVGRGQIELALPIAPFFNIATHLDSTVDAQSAAIFAEVTARLNPRMSLIAGGRVNRDRKTAVFERRSTPVIAALPFGPIFGPDYTGFQESTDTGFSGRAIARYSMSDRMAGYLSYSRGYKGPGIDVALTSDLASIANPGGLPVLKSELPTQWEAGFKTQVGGSFVNIAIFDQTLRNLQTIQTDLNGNLTNLSIDRIGSRGFEVEAGWAPRFVPGVKLEGTLAYLDIGIERWIPMRQPI